MRAVSRGGVNERRAAVPTVCQPRWGVARLTGLRVKRASAAARRPPGCERCPRLSAPVRACRHCRTKDGAPGTQGRVAAAAHMLVSGAQSAARRLQGKARYRKTSEILGMMPAGSGELSKIKPRSDACFTAGEAGDEEWFSQNS